MNMKQEKQKTNPALFEQLLFLIAGSPWLEIVASAWKLGRQIWRGMAGEGMYEVLDYEVTLELQDKRGQRALLNKREKVRYLQDNIIAFQDQAWGEGDFLVNYRCTPGKEVDRYRLGHKTHILIALREEKKRGDIDEFTIEREIHGGFLEASEYCEIGINHRTKRLLLQVIFPEARRPLRTSLVKRTRQRTQILGPEAVTQLLDGRWQVRWETKRPKLHEHYILKWDW